MIQRWLLPTILFGGSGLLVCGLVLALVERRYSDGLAELEAARVEPAQAWRSSWEGAIAAALAEGRGRLARGGTAESTFLLPGGRTVPRLTVAAPRPPADELRRFDLARIGGEGYEFDRGMPGRALDAYCFPLSRIESPQLRARLRFRAARAAMKDGQRKLARALLGELLHDSAGAREGGLPVDMLAGMLLQESFESTDDLVCERLESRFDDLPVTVVRAMLARFDGTDRTQFLEERLAEREELESAVREHRVVLTQGEPALAPPYLLVPGPASAEAARRVARVSIAGPSMESARFSASLTPRAPAPRRGSTTLPLQVTVGAAPAAQLTVEDLAFAAKLEELGAERARDQALAIATILIVAAAGITLWISIDRQRRLAELKVRLLANVSHELKTPVTSIRIFAEMLAHDSLDPKTVKHFGQLLTAESRRLGQRIEDLLEHAARTDRSAALPRESVDVRELLAPLTESFRYRAEQDGIRFDVDLSEPKQTVLDTNSNAIERIVLNLLDNALKYRRPDSPSIEVELENGGGSLHVHVSDNGPGIHQDEQKRIFEEFYRARFQDYGVQGTGLGLAIARKLARGLDGELTVQSQPDVGSRFTLELPLSTPDAEGNS